MKEIVTDKGLIERIENLLEDLNNRQELYTYTYAKLQNGVEECIVRIDKKEFKSDLSVNDDIKFEVMYKEDLIKLDINNILQLKHH